MLYTLLLHFCFLQLALSKEGLATYPYSEWSGPIKSGNCGSVSSPLKIRIQSKYNTSGIIPCSIQNGIKVYSFPPGVFEIDEQMLVPAKSTIRGASNPNDMSNPTKSPDWSTQTVFLATRGVTDPYMEYCYAWDMVTTRVGFVLSSYVTVENVNYQGLDTLRPGDNGALCGGGAFETKGCAKNDCSNSVNNGGSDGYGSKNVVIQNVRLNGYYYEEDKDKIGAYVNGNYDCGGASGSNGCCFCLPNGVRSSQVAIWIPKTRDNGGTTNLVIKNITSMSTQADGINLHGHVDGADVQNIYLQATGDDGFALWGGSDTIEGVVAYRVEVVNPGILRPNWYGNCFATYGMDHAAFEDCTCRAPTLQNPLHMGGGTFIDTSMFVLYTSFGANYPYGNRLVLNGWTFTDLNGNKYSAASGSLNYPQPGKMAWTYSQNAVLAPYYISGGSSVNVFVWGQKET